MNENWTNIIRPKRNYLDINIKELISYKDLIFMFVKRDFVSIYKQTILGPLWFLIQPLFTTLIFTVVFGRMANISTEGIPHILFYLAGISSWNYFADCLNNTASTFKTNQQIFGKVYFPRLTVPISVVISSLLKFGIQFALFLMFYLYYYFSTDLVNPNAILLLFPYLVLLMGLLGLGFGILLSSLTTKYRDLIFLLQFGVQLWMYATPVIYPLSSIPEKYKIFMILNPMTAVIETFKYGFLGKGTFSWLNLGISSLICLVVLVLGIISFNKVEQNFMDTV